MIGSFIQTPLLRGAGVTIPFRRPILRLLLRDIESPRYSKPMLDDENIQRGDLSPSARGAWAGEVGPAQFMPSSYLKFAVDFDGNGRRELVHSVPDVLASTANFLRNYGWQR